MLVYLPLIFGDFLLFGQVLHSVWEALERKLATMQHRVHSFTRHLGFFECIDDRFSTWLTWPPWELVHEILVPVDIHHGLLLWVLFLAYCIQLLLFYKSQLLITLAVLCVCVCVCVCV